MALQAFRPDLLGESDPRAAMGSLDSMSVEYVNIGHDAAGASDIDAVTVVCPGDGAKCKPSN